MEPIRIESIRSGNATSLYGSPKKTKAKAKPKAKKGKKK